MGVSMMEFWGWILLTLGFTGAGVLWGYMGARVIQKDRLARRIEIIRQSLLFMAYSGAERQYKEGYINGLKYALYLLTGDRDFL